LQAPFLYFIVMQVVYFAVSVFYFSNTSRFKDFNAAINAGRSRFFYGKLVTISTQPYTVQNIGFAVIELVLYIVKKWVDHFVAVATVFYGALPITFWIAAKQFENFTSNICVPGGNSTNDARFRQISILGKYDELRSLTDAINDIWSVATFLIVIEKALVMIFLHTYISTRNPAFIAYFTIDIMFLATGLILMAEGARIVSNINHMIKICGNVFPSTNIFTRFSDNPP